MYYTKNNDKNYYRNNESNTNCGSFALNVEEWYETDSHYDDDNWAFASEMYDSGDYTIEEIISALFDRSVEAILNDFDGEITLLPSKDTPIGEDEELIAFRVGTNFWADPEYLDVDFHFQVFRDGRWQEKFGSSEITDCPPNNLERDWETGIFIYEEPTAFFAHKV